MDAFFQAAYCQPPRVLGRRLLPFSLSHLYLLRGLDNGFVTRGAGTRSELFTAVLVCSRTHEQNARAMFGGRLSVWRLMLWSAFWPTRKIAAEREKFADYLSDYCTIPEHWEGEKGKTGEFRAPYVFHFLLTLTMHAGCTLREAWNTPVSLARCLYDTHSEMEGDESLVSERERENIRFLETIPDAVNQ